MAPSPLVGSFASASDRNPTIHSHKGSISTAFTTSTATSTTTTGSSAPALPGNYDIILELLEQQQSKAKHDFRLSSWAQPHWTDIALFDLSRYRFNNGGIEVAQFDRTATVEVNTYLTIMRDIYIPVTLVG
ncbi:unnamed protein product [Phytophthora fragariaefolia]|uniref:Unnamed protein product n=1 Tax=Phytophthora fragariaefolia TaxID=1490495 RepID=A0A9W6XRV7_9STRA|nr:unnamed protein product [Phytophthora fragariaefolia]